MNFPEHRPDKAAEWIMAICDLWWPPDIPHFSGIWTLISPLPPKTMLSTAQPISFGHISTLNLI
jgi:hypothetical protein